MRKYVDWFVEAFVAALMAVMITVVALQVFFRYVIGSPLGWTEEIGNFTLVWSSFLGSYIAFRRGNHLRIELLYLILPNVGRRTLLIIGNLALSGLSVFFVFKGIPFAQKFMYLLSPNLQFPMGISYLVVPITGVLFLINLLPEVYQLLFRADSATTLLKGTYEILESPIKPIESKQGG
jgi:TRAP-type C4-dicarboxylate transport system permease small subunit